MNFEFSEEQNLLREQASGFLQSKCPIEAVRAILESDQPFDALLWKDIAELGWTATTIPEAYGGIGMGYLELCVLAEELGRSLAPVPFATSVYLATEALLLFGSEAQKQKYLPGLAEGHIIGSLALSEGTHPAQPGNLQTRVTAGNLSGGKIPVPDGDVADFAIVVAAEEDAASMVIVDLYHPGVTRETVKTIDPTRSQAELVFSQCPVEMLGEAGAGWPQCERLFNRAAILFAFEQVGGARAALDMAREYAMGRFAFGRSIASFQAIKHKLADMYIATTLAHSNCYYGAWALSTDAAELPLAAATARVSATEAYHECSKENIQTHGGMGFTWEFNCHLYYRRAKALSLNLGSLPRWKDKLVTCLEESNRASA